MARKESNIHYIYKTTNVVTGRYYIGMHSTSNIEDGYMGSGKRLRYSIRKYGIENHVKEILEYLPTRELLIEREKEIVTNELILDDLCMNLAEGGMGGHGAKFLTKEQLSKGGKMASQIVSDRLKCDIELRKKFAENLSKIMIKKHKDGRHNYNNFEGKTHSKETIELMRKSHKGAGIGETNSQYGTRWVAKDGVVKKIKKEELADYLDKGWVNGKK